MSAVKKQITITALPQTVTFASLSISTFSTAPFVTVTPTAGRMVYVDPDDISTTQFIVRAFPGGEPVPFDIIAEIEAASSSGTPSTTTAQEMIARMARDPRLNVFISENRAMLYNEFLYRMLHEAEKEVLRETKCLISESDLTLSDGNREVELPGDFMILEDARYRESEDDAKFEGYPITIVDQENLP